MKRALAIWSVVMLSGLAMLPTSAGAGYPVLNSHVLDETYWLDAEQVAAIEEAGQGVETETGAQVAVLLVDSVEPDGIDFYALRTFEANALGQAGRDDGVLILIVTGTDEWRIEVGYGLEGVLPDVFVNQVGEGLIEPNMANLEYGLAAMGAMLAISEVILLDYDGQPVTHHETWHPVPWLPFNWWQLCGIVAIIILIGALTGGRFFPFFLLLLGGGKGGGRLGGGGRTGGGGAKGGL